MLTATSPKNIAFNELKFIGRGASIDVMESLFDDVSNDIAEHFGFVSETVIKEASVSEFSKILI